MRKLKFMQLADFITVGSIPPLFLRDFCNKHDRRGAYSIYFLSIIVALIGDSIYFIFI